MVGEIGELAVDCTGIIGDQSEIGLLAQLEDGMHLCVLAFVLCVEVLFDECDCAFENVTGWLIVFILVTNCQEKLLNFASKNATREDIKVSEADKRLL